MKAFIKRFLNNLSYMAVLAVMMGMYWSFLSNPLDNMEAQLEGVCLYNLYEKNQLENHAQISKISFDDAHWIAHKSYFPFGRTLITESGDVIMMPKDTPFENIASMSDEERMNLPRMESSSLFYLASYTIVFCLSIAILILICILLHKFIFRANNIIVDLLFIYTTYYIINNTEHRDKEFINSLFCFLFLYGITSILFAIEIFRGKKTYIYKNFIKTSKFFIIIFSGIAILVYFLCSNFLLYSSLKKAWLIYFFGDKILF